MTETTQHKTYHHGDLRNSLIAAGLDIVVNEGFAALDLRKVARVVGVSHTAPYRHFADKEALLAAICIDGFQRLNQRLEQVLAEQPPQLEQRLFAFSYAYVTFALENRALVREMLSGLFVDYQRYPDLVGAMNVAPQLLLQALTEDTARFTSTLMYGITGLTLQLMKQPTLTDDQVQTEVGQLAQVFVHGIGAAT